MEEVARSDMWALEDQRRMLREVTSVVVKSLVSLLVCACMFFTIPGRSPSPSHQAFRRSNHSCNYCCMCYEGVLHFHQLLPYDTTISSPFFIAWLLQTLMISSPVSDLRSSKTALGFSRIPRKSLMNRASFPITAASMPTLIVPSVAER